MNIRERISRGCRERCCRVRVANGDNNRKSIPRLNRITRRQRDKASDELVLICHVCDRAIGRDGDCSLATIARPVCERFFFLR